MKESKQEVLFSHVFLGSSTGFYLNSVESALFEGQSLFVENNRRRRKPTPVCSNHECLLWCCPCVCFHLIFLFFLFVAWFVLYYFSALKRTCSSSRSSVGCTRILITVCNPAAGRRQTKLYNLGTTLNKRLTVTQRSPSVSDHTSGTSVQTLLQVVSFITADFKLFTHMWPFIYV